MDAQTLSEAMGGTLPMARYEALAPAFNQAMLQAGITTTLRAAHWCSQLGHESGGLQWMEEIASGAAYEGRRDLGNTIGGDGIRFKGRGPIQVTGRNNYTQVSSWAHSKGYVPSPTYFVDNPAELASDRYGFLGPVWYWTVARPNLNSLCDADDSVAVTRAINGGTNGLQDRQARLARCKALGDRILPSGSAGVLSVPVVNGKRGVMRDWDNLEADVTKLMNVHYTPGRGGHKIRYIVRHHNAGTRLTVEDCWNLWQTREASAHYQVEASGRIGQLVNDWDTAWHAADLLRNQESIGIEHANCGGPDEDWPISDETIEEGAHLAAALCAYYDLGRPEYGVNIRDHRETGQTACPYHLSGPDGKYHQRWMERAQYWYDNPRAGLEEDDMTPEQSKKLDLIYNQLTGSFTNDEYPGFDIEDLYRKAAGKGFRQMTMMEGVAVAAKEAVLTGDQLSGPGRKADGSRDFKGWPFLGDKTVVDFLTGVGEKVDGIVKFLGSVGKSAS